MQPDRGLRCQETGFETSNTSSDDFIAIERVNANSSKVPGDRPL